MPSLDDSAVCAWSVVVPFYNEAACAADLLAELNRTLVALGRPYEILMMDDGSADATPQILAAIASATPACRHVRLQPNRGQAAALYHGLHLAAGEVIITLDGDGQNDPADIPALLARLAAADWPDMVVGIRARRKDSWLRRKISRLANAVRSRVLGDGVTDSGCALKVFRREVREAMIPIRTLYSFMPALAVGAGFRVVELPVNHRPRAGGKSSYGLMVFLWRPVLDMLGVWWFTSRRFPPIRAERGPTTGA
jgi:dolichol-phosphate mannosyltransferase